MISGKSDKRGANDLFQMTGYHAPGICHYLDDDFSLYPLALHAVIEDLESGKRTGTWVKYKVNRGQEFVIGGYTPGNPFDALIVGYYEGERLFYAAKVRNGFVPLVRREVASRFKGLEIDTCPFANLPEKKRTQWALTKEEMKNCVWLKMVHSGR